MNNVLKTLLYLTAIIAILIGLNAFRYHNNIFEESFLPCCNNAMCNGEPCTTIVGAKLTLNNCYPEYTINCYQCLYYNYYNLVCSAQPMTYCTRSDGSRYYGGPDDAK